MSTFEVGQKVIIVNSKNPNRIGKVVRIVSPLVSHCTVSGKCYVDENGNSGKGYEVDLESTTNPGTFSAYQAKSLRPLPPQKTTTWDACAWQPKELVHVD